MSPGAVADRIKGGHLYIPELKAAILDTGEIKSLGKGFFDMEIQYIGKQSLKYKNNSFFPMGTSVEEAVEILENACKNIKKIKNITPEGQITQMTYLVEHGQLNHFFKMHIEKNVVTFYPFNK